MTFAANEPPDNPADALFQAAARGDIAALRAEMKTRNINDADEHGWTPLIWAVSANEMPAAKFLLEKGAAVDAPAAGGWTALMYAADARNAPMAALLLAFKANSFLRNDDNDSAGDLARRSGDDVLARQIESRVDNPGMALTRDLPQTRKPPRWKV